MSSTEWDEVFAMAEGNQHPQEPTSASSSAKEAIQDDESHPHGDHRRKKKRRLLTTNNDIISFSDYLQERCRNSQEVACYDPSYFTYTRSFQQDICKQYKRCKNDDDDDGATTTRGTAKICQRCTHSRQAHVLQMKNTVSAEAASWHIQLFCIVRNVRCECVLAAAVTTNHNFNTPVGNVDFQQQGNLLKDIILFKNINNNQRKDRKLDSVLEKCQILMGLLFQRNSHKKGDYCFDELVEIVIACDAVYYQLYYWQLTTTTTTAVRIPHPLAYFGESNGSNSSELLQRFLDKLKTTTLHHHNQRFRQINEAFGLDDGITAKTNDDNVLATLHRLRWAETVHLFHASSSGKTFHELHPQPFLHQRRQQEHETLAPPLLAQWRDSCRDFLCHLYAYATVSDSVLELLRQRLQSSNNILEMGAGTGYMAYLLHCRGLSVSAYDAAPTAVANYSHNNEYHAATPSFVTVYQGKADSKKLWQSVKKSPTALLLCYPPPNDSMAYTALKNYIKAAKQSQRVVHIGEFQGLTGSPKFERLLLQNFVCTDRWPCLTWCTDAAEITVWDRRQPSNKANNGLLLPCSFCQTKEAVRRCRWLRMLQYCSATCCHADIEPRRYALQVAMIGNLEDSDDYQLQFENDQHFCQL